jgi:NAD-dependent DNA ligase
MKINTAKEKQPKIKLLTPRQAEKELAALRRLYNEEDAKLISDQEYDRLKSEIMGRLTGRQQ